MPFISPRLIISLYILGYNLKLFHITTENMFFDLTSNFSNKFFKDMPLSKYSHCNDFKNMFVKNELSVIC